MKTKRMTKISVLAIAFAAVLGIATVSFAAWQGGSATVSAQASTGHINVYGFDTNATLALLGEGETLVPYDQEGALGEKQKTFISAELPAYTVTGAYDIKVTVSGASLAVGSAFKVSVGDSRLSETPKKAEVDTWKNIGEKVEESTTAVNATISGKYLHIVLVSGNVADMDKDLTFTVTLTQTNA